MELNLGQLSTLNEMGIPVWELRSNAAVELSAVNDELSPIELSEQQLMCDCWVMIESQLESQQAERLLHAMLNTIGITQEKITIVNPAQIPQLQSLPSQNKVLLVLGDSLAQSTFGDTVIRGKAHTILDSELTTIVSFALDDLLALPENKALAWQDLQLVKQYLIQ
ncbi:MAG: DNA polymerase III subunit psi [Piscirickettsiaceae bacterium]|nr:DNA polymerase III subunit psi [Piscirickettsiaceae bacterium]